MSPCMLHGNKIYLSDFQFNTMFTTVRAIKVPVFLHKFENLPHEWPLNFVFIALSILLTNTTCGTKLIAAPTPSNERPYLLHKTMHILRYLIIQKLENGAFII